MARFIEKYLQAAALRARRSSVEKSKKRNTHKDLIDIYKREYAKAYAMKDYAGMRLANDKANAVRRKNNLPTESSKLGDMQRASGVRITPELKSMAAQIDKREAMLPAIRNVQYIRHSGGGKFGKPNTTTMYDGYGSNDIHNIMHQSRMPMVGYDEKTARKIGELSKVGAEKNKFMYNFLENSGMGVKKPIENKIGANIDTRAAERGFSAGAGKMAGMAVQYGLTGPAAAGTAGAGKLGSLVAKNIAAGGLRKVATRTAIDSAAAIPMNVGMGLKAGFAGDKFDAKSAAKEFAINTAFDVGLGGAIHGGSVLLPKAGKGIVSAHRNAKKPLEGADFMIDRKGQRVPIVKTAELPRKAGRKFTSNLLTTDKETGKRIITNGDISVRSDFSDDATAEFFDNSYVKNSIDVPEIKRVKDANLDVCDLSDESIKTAKEIIKGATEELDGQRKVKISKIKTLYKNKLRGKHRFLTNNNTTFDGEIYSVEFTGNSLSKTIGYNYRNPVHLALLDNLDTVFGEAHYIGSSKFMPEGKKPQNTVRYDYFRSFVKNNEGTEGGIYRVDIDIRIRKNEDRSYKVHKVGEVVGVKTEDIKISSAEMPATGNSVVLQNFPPRGNASTRGLFKTNIADGLENVNKGGRILAPRPGTEAATPKKRNLIDRAAGIDLEQELAQFDKEYEGMPIEHKGGIEEFAGLIESKGITRGKQIERNLDAALKRTPAGRRWFKENLEYPLFASKAKYAKRVEDMRKELHKEIVVKFGIKKDTKESAAVQWLGEGERWIKIGEDGKPVRLEYGLEQLKEDFAYKMENGRFAWENIVDAERKFREMYDRYVDELNVSMEKMYPHHKENVQRLKNRISNLQERAVTLEYSIKYGSPKSKIEIDTRHYTNVRKTEDGLKNQLANIDENIAKEQSNIREATMFGTKDDVMVNKQRLSELHAQRDLIEVSLLNRLYTGGKSDYAVRTKRVLDKSPTELNMELSEVRHKLKEAEQELSREMTHRLYPQENYFRHFTEMTDGGFFAQLRNIKDNPVNIDPRLVGISEYTQPNSKFASFMQHRKWGYHEADAVKGMLDYIEPLAHKIYIEPNIKNIRNIISELRVVTNGNANELIQYLKEYADSLAGKTNPLDRAVLLNVGEKGRTALKFLDRITSRFRTNAVLGNMNTMTAQVFNYPNVAALAGNPKDLIIGTAQAMSSYVPGTPEAELIAKSPFLKERFLDRSERIFETKVGKKIVNKLVFAMEVGDEAVARSSWLTFYRQALNGNEKFLKSLNIKKETFDMSSAKMQQSAVFWADEMTRRAIAGRGVGEMSLAQSARVTKMFMPFQVEVANTMRLLEDLVGAKDAKGIFAFMITMTLMNHANEALTGRRVGYDPISATEDAIRLYYGDSEEAGDKKALALNMLANNMGEFISNYPGGSYIASEIGHYTGADKNPLLRRTIFGDNDPSRFGTGNMAIQSFARPIADTVLYALGSNKKPDYLKPMMGILPKAGGRQIERSIRYGQDRGLLPKVDVFAALPGGKPFVSMNDVPGSYTSGGDLRFVLNKSPTNDAKGFLFGTWATQEGREYIRDKKMPLRGESTVLTKSLVKSGAEPVKAEKFTREFMSHKKKSEKEDMLLNSDLPKKQREGAAAYLNKNVKNKRDYSSKTMYEITAMPEYSRDKINNAIKSGVKPKDALGAFKSSRKTKSSSEIVQALSMYEDNIDAAKYYKAFGISDLQLDKGYNYHEAGFKAIDLAEMSKFADTNGSGNVNKGEISLYLLSRGYTQDQVSLYFKIKYAK